MTDSNRNETGVQITTGEFTRWFTTAFGLGFVVGGIVGLLYAPKPGKELREDIKVKAGEMKEKAGVTAKDVGTKVGSTIREVSDKAREQAKEIKTRTDDILDRAKSALEAGKEEFGKDGEDGEAEAENA